MADAVTALTGWRQRRDVVRAEHTREVVKSELSPAAEVVLLKLATELDQHRAEILQLKLVIARLAIEAAREEA